MPEGNNGNGNGKEKKDPVERLLEGIQAMGAKLDAVCSRVDAMEAARAAPPRPLAIEKDGDIVEGDPTDKGKPAPTAADAGPLNELRKRRAKLASFQQAADSVAAAFGETAAPPLTNEALNQYKRRTLLRWQKFSPDWKDVDLYAMDEGALDVAATQIFESAKAEGRRPSVPQGFLMERKVHDNGHYITSFYGSPSVWMNRWAGPRRFVSRINTKPDVGYSANH